MCIRDRFLCVLGAVLLALFSLSRMAQRGGERVATTAFDIPLVEASAPEEVR